ncbi:hypothetical protein EV360DRAFT_75176 [Lentinula raphanica]|nr:hypothetical protein EV360DRAFT_75176 [Lentinula raphanica]
MSKRSAISKGNGTVRKRQKKNVQAQLPLSSNEESNPRTAAQRNEGNEGKDNEEDEDQDGEDIQDTPKGIKAKKEAITMQISEDKHYKNEEWHLPLHSEKELAKHKSTVYAFFEGQLEIQFARDHLAEYLLYSCSKCRNLREHVKNLEMLGEEVLTAVKDSTLEKAQAAVRDFEKMKQTTLTLVVNSVISWFKSFSTRPPEKEKIWYVAFPTHLWTMVTAHWVAESRRSFLVVCDRGFHWLQKEGRPNHYVPSNETVARDVKKLYNGCRTQLAKVLEDYGIRKTVSG